MAIPSNLSFAESLALGPYDTGMDRRWSDSNPHRLSLGLFTAALWSWSLPEQDSGWLASIALVPLIIARERPLHYLQPLVDS